MASQGVLFLSTELSPSKNHPRVHRAHSTLLSLSPRTETKTARAVLPIVRAMLNAGRPALLVAFSFPLITKISDLIFGDVLGALQTFPRAAGCLTLPIPREMFLTALAKAALPPRVVAAPDEQQQLRLCFVPCLT